MRKPITFSITDIANLIKRRQENQFDANFSVQGERGNGKSTLISKILYKIGNFNPRVQQVYSTDDVIKLLQTQKRGIVFNDEGINSGYKRNFQDKGQQKLIKVLTNYRSNENIHATAIPNFFSLDKDLRDLTFMLLVVVERGHAHVHLPLQGRMYSQDRWDAKNNARKEESWNNQLKNNVSAKIPYHELSTFAGHLFFGDLSPHQRALYEEVRKSKRAEQFQEAEQEIEVKKAKPFIERVYDLVLEKKLNSNSLLQLCLWEGESYKSVRTRLNQKLKDNGYLETAKDFLDDAPEVKTTSLLTESLDNQKKEVLALLPKT